MRSFAFSFIILVATNFALAQSAVAQNTQGRETEERAACQLEIVEWAESTKDTCAFYHMTDPLRKYPRIGAGDDITLKQCIAEAKDRTVAPRQWTHRGGGHSTCMAKVVLYRFKYETNIGYVQ